MAALADGVHIVYNSVVAKIAYCAQGVAVHTARHVFKGTPSDITSAILPDISQLTAADIMVQMT